MAFYHVFLFSPLQCTVTDLYVRPLNKVKRDLARTIPEVIQQRMLDVFVLLKSKDKVGT
jgi:hypothetical protein